MSEGPILHLYKYGRKTELHTDACKQGYGAILLQEAEDGKLHPVYYMSKKTNTAEENISEDYAKKELITRIARWALQLEEFDYEIEHRAGSRMKHVDALSRYPVMMVCNDTLTSKLKKAQEEDDNIQTLKSLLEKQESEEFFERNAFPSKLFRVYCDEENIQHLQIATGVLRGNGQVERIHRTLIPVLTKLSLDDSTKWYKYVDRLQRILNSTISRSTKWTPFELLVGIKMRNKEDILIKDLLLEEMAKELLEQREFLRNDAKKNIETLQSENRKTYNRRRKKASLYKENDLVAIQRTQFGAGLKRRPKFLGPYKVTKVNSKDRYEVEKVGQHDGPNSTTTSADLMKHFYA
ncbi:retrovirus-related Pol polyprotein from transposon 17.6 [Trichonephila clavipes]|uniref:Retrovirus-related Pol polyprotein from transposon 17.6 n=1 Tax=Trichonephila clavipes TaxID=2585209 RepID=A0A8X6WD03_TRICX|nr:retrovirus-related Pol polyprotein from transposon 17.6 [Trichonephila clavipes]